MLTVCVLCYAAPLIRFSAEGVRDPDGAVGADGTGGPALHICASVQGPSPGQVGPAHFPLSPLLSHILVMVPTLPNWTVQIGLTGLSRLAP